MPRCFRLLAFLLAAVLAAGPAQAVPLLGTAPSLDVAACNVGRFGSAQSGPSNETLQPEYVADALRQSGIDVWALQENASFTAFDPLLGTFDARFGLTPAASTPGASGWTFSLGVPYPNPFTDTATLTYTLDQSGPVLLELFDALGRRVAVIEDEARPAGEYRVRFNGRALTPGLYVVRLTAGDHIATRRLVRGN